MWGWVIVNLEKQVRKLSDITELKTELQNQVTCKLCKFNQIKYL